MYKIFKIIKYKGDYYKPQVASGCIKCDFYKNTCIIGKFRVNPCGLEPGFVYKRYKPSKFMAGTLKVLDLLGFIKQEQLSV